jgi:3-oxoacyl-[acyl-carrier-protein] synthase II
LEVVVTGIGLLSCLGNLRQSWQALLEGRSGIRLAQPFPELPPLPLGLISAKPSFLNDLIQAIVTDAIADACLELPLPDCGVVIGSSRGCQANWEELMRRQEAEGQVCRGNPLWLPWNRGQEAEDGDRENLNSWLETFPDRAAIATAGLIGSGDVVAAPMAACSTGIWAIAQAVDLIQTGRCQRVIAGAVEAPITRMTIAGFNSMGALAKTGCYPFDRDHEGLVLGEGGAVLVLESAELALSRGAKIYGKILGVGLTCDAYHLSAPNPNCWTAALAVKQCLATSNLEPKDIDFIHAHGTSTQLNDRHEAELITSLFPKDTYVSSTKGATGHTLGASGAIAAAFGLMSLQNQQLPPCVGLKTSEFNLNLVEIRQAHIQTLSDRDRVKNSICFSFGFGGQNTAIALSKFAQI